MQTGIVTDGNRWIMTGTAMVNTGHFRCFYCSSVSYRSLRIDMYIETFNQVILHGKKFVQIRWYQKNGMILSSTRSRSL